MLNTLRTTRMSRLATGALLVGALTLSGCNTQRPLPRVWEMGDRAFDKADYNQARAEYGEYLERKPGEARVQHRMALTLLELGRAQEAVEWAVIAHDQRPGDEQFIETRARALFEARRNDELYAFLRLMTQDRGRVADYLRLGDYSSRLGDPDGAESAFLLAARLDGGKNLEPQIALADFYASINDMSNAKKRLRMALFIDPTNEILYHRLRAMGEIPGPSLAIVPAEAD